MKVHSRLRRIYIALQVALWVYLIFVFASLYLSYDFRINVFLGLPIAVVFALVVLIKLRPSDS